jgi:hypothetical protein
MSLGRRPKTMKQEAGGRRQFIQLTTYYLLKFVFNIPHRLLLPASCLLPPASCLLFTEEWGGGVRWWSVASLRSRFCQDATGVDGSRR